MGHDSVWLSKTHWLPWINYWIKSPLIYGWVTCGFPTKKPWNFPEKTPGSDSGRKQFSPPFFVSMSHAHCPHPGSSCSRICGSGSKNNKSCAPDSQTTVSESHGSTGNSEAGNRKSPRDFGTPFWTIERCNRNWSRLWHTNKTYHKIAISIWDIERVRFYFQFNWN